MQQCLCNPNLIIFSRRCKQRCCVQDQRAVAMETATNKPRCLCGCFRLSCFSYQYLCSFFCLHLLHTSVYVCMCVFPALVSVKIVLLMFIYTLDEAVCPLNSCSAVCYVPTFTQSCWAPLTWSVILSEIRNRTFYNPQKYESTLFGCFALFSLSGDVIVLQIGRRPLSPEV